MAYVTDELSFSDYRYLASIAFFSERKSEKDGHDQFLQIAKPAITKAFKQSGWATVKWQTPEIYITPDAHLWSFLPNRFRQNFGTYSNARHVISAENDLGRILDFQLSVYNSCIAHILTLSAPPTFKKIHTDAILSLEVKEIHENDPCSRIGFGDLTHGLRDQTRRDNMCKALSTMCSAFLQTVTNG